MSQIVTLPTFFLLAWTLSQSHVQGYFHGAEARQAAISGWASTLALTCSILCFEICITPTLTPWEEISYLVTLQTIPHVLPGYLEMKCIYPLTGGER